MATRSGSQYAAGFFGFLILAVSVPCVAAGLYEIVTMTSASLSASLSMVTFMGFVALAGMVLVRFGLRKRPAASIVVTAPFENRTLQFAHQNGGHVTVAQLALHTHLTVDQASATLEHLAKRGVAQPHLTDDGELLYDFPGFDARMDANDDFAAFDAELEQSEPTGEFFRPVTFQDDEAEVELDLGADGSVAAESAHAHYVKHDS